ncbi:hypothetical protein EDB83DRAFT_2233507, partial [Lactarius deliciosus]
SHMRSPFHRMSRWTGSHFAPISLLLLGFKLCFGHNGKPSPLPLSHTPEYMEGISDTLFDLAEDMFDPSDGYRRRAQTAKSGNPLITIVNQTGVFDMDVLFCICPNAGANDEQLLQAGLFPLTFNQIETAFTFSVLDDFLADNLECKTTAQQYYSKLQGITNRMFPGHVPVS